MPTSEAWHERANRITIEAIRIARRDGRTVAERALIYEREVDRLIAEEPAYRPAEADSAYSPRCAEQRMTQSVSAS